MPRYWVIAPFESKPVKLFDKVWQFDLANNLISIGWAELGDVSEMNQEELGKAIESTYKKPPYKKPPGTRGLYRNMIWAFYHEIRQGDFIIARRGRKTLAAVGEVSQSAFYAPGTNPAPGHPNSLKVSWHAQPRDKVFPSIVFPMQTLAELPEEQFRNLLEDSSPEPVPAQAAEATEDTNADSQFVRTGSGLATLDTRTGQHAFSDAVRENYSEQCCFPRCPVNDRAFLVGAHIARWSDSPELRGNVANGLCFCLMHDKAFEDGLFILDPRFRVTPTPLAKDSPWATANILPFADQHIRIGRVRPDLACLERHWQRVGHAPLNEAT